MTHKEAVRSGSERYSKVTRMKIEQGNVSLAQDAGMQKWNEKAETEIANQEDRKQVWSDN